MWPSSSAHSSSCSVPFSRVAPAEGAVVLDEGARGEQVAVIATVDDLVDVTERHVRRRHPEIGQRTDLLERPGPGLAMGQDRRARGEMRRRGGLEDPEIPSGRSALAAGDLDDPGPVLGPADVRPAVVIGVDADGHVEREPLGDDLDRQPDAPVVRSVVALVVETGRRDDVDPGTAAQLGQLQDVAAAVARHRVDDGPEPERRPPRRPRRPCRSTSPRSKSGCIRTGAPPSITRCSWA